MSKKNWIISAALLSILTGILCVRNYYSFCWSDESLYMAEVHRLFLGERPFVDEWHPTQFYAVLLLPWYQLYVRLNGSTDGIYLWARHLYLFLSFGVGLYSCYILKKYIKVTMGFSIAAGALIMLYSRACVAGISYHNTFMLLTVLADMLLIHATQCWYIGGVNRRCRVVSILSGICIGMAMVTIPLIFLPFVIILLGVLIWTKRKAYFADICKIVFCVLIGVGVIGFCYLVFLLSRISVGELLTNIHNVLADEQHQTKSLLDYVWSVYELCKTYAKYIIALFLLLCVLARILFVMKRIDFPAWLINILFGLSIISLIYNASAMNSHMGHYVMFGLYSFLVVCIYGQRLLNGGESAWFIIPAIMVIITFSLASATIDPMSAGFVFLTILTIIWLSKLAEKEDRKWVKNGYIFPVILLLSMALYIRIISVYRDAPLVTLNTKILDGPAKGLITTKKHTIEYEECMEVMNYINSLPENEKDTLWVSKLAPWMYVCTEIHNGAPSPWRYGIDSSLVESYYQNHDIENLKYIVVLEESYGGYEQSHAADADGTDLIPNKNKFEGYMWEEIQRNYMVMNFECGNLYIRMD